MPMLEQLRRGHFGSVWNTHGWRSRQNAATSMQDLTGLYAQDSGGGGGCQRARVLTVFRQDFRRETAADDSCGGWLTCCGWATIAPAMLSRAQEVGVRDAGQRRECTVTPSRGA